MHPTPILLLTHDDFLWKHWRSLDGGRWMLARGHSLADLSRWRQQGRTLAIIDTGMARLPEWQAEAWRQHLQDIRAIVASVRPSDEEGARTIIAGAHGYCHAYATPETLSRVLESVLSGSVWMGASLVSRLLRQVDALSSSPACWRHSALTERERAIARYVSQGESNGRIAASMGVSERTVKAYLTSIFEKLGVADRLQLALLVHGIKAP